MAGFSVDVSLARFASLQPDIGYVQIGIRLDGLSVAGASSERERQHHGTRFDYGRLGIDGRFDGCATSFRRPTAEPAIGNGRTAARRSLARFRF